MMDDRRVLELLEYYLDGDLAQAEEAELVAYAQQDPLHLQHLRGMLRDHIVCRVAMRTSTGAELQIRARQMVDGLNPQRAEKAAANIFARSMRQRRNRIRFHWVRFAAAALFVVLAVPGLWFLASAGSSNMDERAPQVAASSGDQASQRGMRLAVGDLVRFDDPVRTAPGASLELRWTDGTTVRLEGDTTMARLPGTHERLRLYEGTLQIQAAKRAPEHALEVLCPDVHVQVVGTRFTVSTREQASTVTVNEGLVQVKRWSDGTTSLLGAGQQISAKRLPLPTPFFYTVEHLQALREAIAAKRQPWVESMAALQADVRNLQAMSLPEAGEVPVPRAGGPEHEIHLRARGTTDHLCRPMVGLALYGRLESDEAAAISAMSRIRRATELRLTGEEADLLVSDMLAVHVLQAADLLRTTPWWSDADSQRLDRWVTEIALPSATRLANPRNTPSQRCRGLAAGMAIEGWRGNQAAVRDRMTRLRQEVRFLLPAGTSRRLVNTSPDDSDLFQIMIHVLMAADVARIASGDESPPPPEWGIAIQSFVQRVAKLKLTGMQAESALTMALSGDQAWRTTSIPEQDLYPATYSNSYCWYYPALQVRDPRWR